MIEIMALVKLYANLRKLAGTKELSITGASVGAALNELAKQNPTLGAAILLNGVLRPYVIVTVNGHTVIDLNTPLAEDDVLAVFPPIAGGFSLPSIIFLQGEGGMEGKEVGELRMERIGEWRIKENGE